MGPPGGSLLVRVTLTGAATPRAAARGVVTGGVVLARRPARPAAAAHLDDYGRSARDRLGRRADRATRTGPAAGRLVRRGRPPRAAPVGRPPGSWRPRAVRVGATLLGWPTRVGRAAAHLAGRAPGGGPARVALQVGHPGRLRFARWAARPAGVYRPGWYGFQPTKSTDPVRLRREWAHLTGASPVGGLRRRSTLGVLRRRRRARRRLARRLARWCRYPGGVRRRRARRRRPGRRRYLLFRRRRARRYRARRVTPRTYVRHLTRPGFRRWATNRAARAARAAHLGGPTVAALAEWVTHPFGGRVTTPLEYNLHRPGAGYFKLEKRRRPGSRRLKLGQHPTGAPHREARQLRWAWFETTPLGGLVRAGRAGSPPPADPPVRPGLAAGVYWAGRKWGRSRWDRPTGRAARVFVTTLKSGTTLEGDVRGWGTAAAGPAGVLLSVRGETELGRPARAGPARAGPPGRVGRWTRRVGRWTALGVRRAGAVAWWVATPVWWSYRWVAAGVALALTAGVALAAEAAAVGRAATAGLLEAAWEVRLALRRVAWGVGRGSSLVRTLGWVYSAWMVTYSSEDDQAELDLVLPNDEDYILIIDDDAPHLQEDDQDFDQLGIGVHRQVPPGEFPFEEGWYPDFDGWWDDLTEQVEEYLLDELPHRAGLLVRPVADFLVRLPVWGLLEGASLVGLTLKLETHRRWYNFVTGPAGRPAKVAAVAAVWAGRLAVWAALFTWELAQLDYVTLRVEVTTTWGAPWQEEYYLLWWCFCFVTSVYLAGPVGWKNFLFREVGPNYLVGGYLGVVEAATPDEYYPARPVRPVVREYHRVVPAHPIRDDYMWYPDETDRTNPAARTNLGYDDVRAVLAREYGMEDEPYELHPDLEIPGFLFPVHQVTRPTGSPFLDHEGLLRRLPENLAHERGYRDGGGGRVDRYRLDFPVTNLTTPYVPYVVEDLSTRQRLEGTPDDDGVV